MAQTRDRAVSRSHHLAAVTKQDSSLSNVLSLLLPYIKNDHETLARIGETSRFFYNQTHSILVKNPAYLMNGIRALHREISIGLQTVLPSLDDTPCSIRHLLFTLPDNLEAYDESVSAILKYASRNQAILQYLEFIRDAGFLMTPSSAALGVLMMAVGYPALGMELVLLALVTYALICYFDKYVINESIKRDHYFPHRNDLLSTPTFHALGRRYTELTKLCQAWLQLDESVKNDYDDNINVFPQRDEEVLIHTLKAEFRP